MSSPIFTEAELDAAADKMAGGAMYECPDRIHDFLTESQATGLRADIREFVKTSLLFDVMNHLEPEPAGGRCPACGEDEMDGGRCTYCGHKDYVE